MLSPSIFPYAKQLEPLWAEQLPKQCRGHERPVLVHPAEVTQETVPTASRCAGLKMGVRLLCKEGK